MSEAREKLIQNAADEIGISYGEMERVFESINYSNANFPTEGEQIRDRLNRKFGGKQ